MNTLIKDTIKLINSQGNYKMRKLQPDADGRYNTCDYSHSVECNSTTLLNYLMRKYPFNMRDLIAGLVDTGTANEEELTDIGRFSPISDWPIIFKTSTII
jgi:hypothetical protein